MTARVGRSLRRGSDGSRGGGGSRGDGGGGRWPRISLLRSVGEGVRVRGLRGLPRTHKLAHTHDVLGRCRQDGVVVVVLLLLTEDLELQEELLLLEDFGVGRVQMGRRLFISLLVRRDVLMVL